MLRWKTLSKARGIVDSSSPGPTTPRNSLSPVFFAAFDHYDMHVLIASNFCLIMFCFQSTRANDSTLIRVNEFAKQTFGQHDSGSCQLDGVPVAGYRLRPSPAASASLPVSQPAALRASGRLTAAAAGGCHRLSPPCAQQRFEYINIGKDTPYLPWLREIRCDASAALYHRCSDGGSPRGCGRGRSGSC